MNCAVITISSGRRRLMERKKFNAFPFANKKRALGPQIFLANLSNGCTTQEGADVEFPDPGDNVSRSGSGKTAAPKGNCGNVKVSGGGGGGGGGGSVDCAFWRAQGYICSRAASLDMLKNLRWVGLLVLGMLGLEVWAL